MRVQRLPEPQTRETLREWDRRAIEAFGIPGIVLMENAGAGAARGIASLLESAPDRFPAPVAILCGAGNNGGDGLVVARHLHNAGINVEVHLAFTPRPELGKSDALVQLGVVERMAIPLMREFAPHPPPAFLAQATPCTVIDALLGTGLSRCLDQPFLDWVRAVNGSGFPVIALDLPTGLDANSGQVLGDCVTAVHTFTFAAPKVGFFRGEGPLRCGVVHWIDIGMPRQIWEAAGNASRPRSPAGG